MSLKLGDLRQHFSEVSILPETSLLPILLLLVSLSIVRLGKHILYMDHQLVQPGIPQRITMGTGCSKGECLNPDW